jgi:hypothetical protein
MDETLGAIVTILHSCLLLRFCIIHESDVDGHGIAFVYHDIPAARPTMLE